MFRDDLWRLVTARASCATGALDPDEWFPVAVNVASARQEAAAAIAVCGACPVRRYCLELSLRHWSVGRHGIWGGLVAAEREELRARLPGRPRVASADTAKTDRTAS